MKILVHDGAGEGTGMDIAMRALDAGHTVRYWLPTHAGDPIPYGDGLVEKPDDWEPEMDWADLIILTDNSKYRSALAPYFGKGYPIFGTNEKAGALELDRAVGQEVLKDHGIETLPYKVVDSCKEAIAHVVKTKKAFAMKPWGGDADKAMTHIARDAQDAIFTLDRWDREGCFKGQLMMQEKVDGVEMGISGWFGPGGWSAVMEESFEHKKFLNDDLGENTGEMGTVIRHVAKSKLFDMMLEPLTDYLHMCNYVGDASVNCIIDKSGQPWPLEFTMRLGWPDFCIRQAVIQGDPVEWMLDLVEGRDTLKVSTEIAVGVLMAHGDFPKHHDPLMKWTGYPITGITSANVDRICFQQVMQKRVPYLMGGSVKQQLFDCTAGTYVLVTTGTGRTVEKAAQRATDLAWSIKWPSNVMFRTDIGKRLERELPLLQKHGFAEGMKYG